MSASIRVSLALVALVSNAAAARVLLGVDNLVKHHRDAIAGAHIGIVTNQTGVTGDGRRTIDAIRAVPGATLVAIFSPEHGATGTATAGTQIASSVDSAAHVPIYSLYGATRSPTPAMLAGIDLIVFDMQDIGIRSYTFISTLGVVMQAAARAGIKLVVLDRPGPLAHRVDGNVLDTAFRSFVGMYPIPYVYGLTIGELATMLNEEGMLGARCALTVIPMIGWHRGMAWDSTGVPWRATSPNVRTESTVPYCAAFGALGELGVAYQGIGTPDAFRVVGGPRFPARAVADSFVAHPLRGVHVTECDTTVASKNGSAMHITCVRFALREDSVQDLFAVGLRLFEVLCNAGAVGHPDSAHIAMFNKVCGAATYQAIRDGGSVAQIVTSWRTARAAYMARRAKYLRYR